MADCEICSKPRDWACPSCGTKNDDVSKSPEKLCVACHIGDVSLGRSCEGCKDWVLPHESVDFNPRQERFRKRRYRPRTEEETAGDGEGSRWLSLNTVSGEIPGSNGQAYLDAKTGKLTINLYCAENTKGMYVDDFIALARNWVLSKIKKEVPEITGNKVDYELESAAYHLDGALLALDSRAWNIHRYSESPEEAKIVPAIRPSASLEQ